MNRELIQQLVLRLQQITPQQLDQLQQTAEAKAKAEADALEALASSRLRSRSSRHPAANPRSVSRRAAQAARPRLDET